MIEALFKGAFKDDTINDYSTTSYASSSKLAHDDDDDDDSSSESSSFVTETGTAAAASECSNSNVMTSSANNSNHGPSDASSQQQQAHQYPPNPNQPHKPQLQPPESPSSQPHDTPPISPAITTCSTFQAHIPTSPVASIESNDHHGKLHVQSTQSTQSTHSTLSPHPLHQQHQQHQQPHQQQGSPKLHSNGSNLLLSTQQQQQSNDTDQPSIQSSTSYIHSVTSYEVDDDDEPYTALIMPEIDANSYQSKDLSTNDKYLPNNNTKSSRVGGRGGGRGFEEGDQSALVMLDNDEPQLPGIIDVSTIQDEDETGIMHVTFSMDMADTTAGGMSGTGVCELDMPDLSLRNKSYNNVNVGKNVGGHMGLISILDDEHMSEGDEEDDDDDEEGSSGTSTDASSAILNIWNEDYDGNPDPEVKKKLLAAKKLPSNLDPKVAYQIRREQIIRELEELDDEYSSDGSYNIMLKTYCYSKYICGAETGGDPDIDVSDEEEDLNSLSPSQKSNTEASIEEDELNHKRPKKSQYGLLPDGQYKPGVVQKELVLMLPRGVKPDALNQSDTSYLPVGLPKLPNGSIHPASPTETNWKEGKSTPDSKSPKEQGMEFTLQNYDSTPHRIAQLVMEGKTSDGAYGTNLNSPDAVLSSSSSSSPPLNSPLNDTSCTDLVVNTAHLDRFVIPLKRCPDDDDHIEMDRSIASEDTFQREMEEARRMEHMMEDSATKPLPIGVEPIQSVDSDPYKLVERNSSSKDTVMSSSDIPGTEQVVVRKLQSSSPLFFDKVDKYEPYDGDDDADDGSELSMEDWDPEIHDPKIHDLYSPTNNRSYEGFGNDDDDDKTKENGDVPAITEHGEIENIPTDERAFDSNQNDDSNLLVVDNDSESNKDELPSSDGNNDNPGEKSSPVDDNTIEEEVPTVVDSEGECNVISNKEGTALHADGEANNHADESSIHSESNAKQATVCDEDDKDENKDNEEPTSSTLDKEEHSSSEVSSNVPIGKHELDDGQKLIEGESGKIHLVPVDEEVSTPCDKVDNCKGDDGDDDDDDTIFLECNEDGSHASIVEVNDKNDIDMTDTVKDSGDYNEENEEDKTDAYSHVSGAEDDHVEQDIDMAETIQLKLSDDGTVPCESAQQNDDIDTSDAEQLKNSDNIQATSSDASPDTCDNKEDADGNESAQSKGSGDDAASCESHQIGESDKNVKEDSNKIERGIESLSIPSDEAREVCTADVTGDDADTAYNNTRVAPKELTPDSDAEGAMNNTEEDASGASEVTQVNRVISDVVTSASIGEDPLESSELQAANAEDTPVQTPETSFEEQDVCNILEVTNEESQMSLNEIEDEKDGADETEASICPTATASEHCDENVGVGQEKVKSKSIDNQDLKSRDNGKAATVEAENPSDEWGDSQLDKGFGGILDVTQEDDCKVSKYEEKESNISTTNISNLLDLTYGSASKIETSDSASCSLSIKKGDSSKENQGENDLRLLQNDDDDESKDLSVLEELHKLKKSMVKSHIVVKGRTSPSIEMAIANGRSSPSIPLAIQTGRMSPSTHSECTSPLTVSHRNAKCETKSTKSSDTSFSPKSFIPLTNFLCGSANTDITLDSVTSMEPEEYASILNSRIKQSNKAISNRSHSSSKHNKKKSMVVNKVISARKKMDAKSKDNLVLGEVTVPDGNQKAVSTDTISSPTRRNSNTSPIMERAETKKESPRTMKRRSIINNLKNRSSDVKSDPSSGTALTELSLLQKSMTQKRSILTSPKSRKVVGSTRRRKPVSK